MDTVTTRVQGIIGEQLALEPLVLEFGKEGPPVDLMEVVGLLLRTLAATQRALLVVAEELDKLTEEP